MVWLKSYHSIIPACGNGEQQIIHKIWYRFCSEVRDTHLLSWHGAQPLCVEHFTECSGKKGQKLSLCLVLSSFPTKTWSQILKVIFDQLSIITLNLSWVLFNLVFILRWSFFFFFSLGDKNLIKAKYQIQNFKLLTCRESNPCWIFCFWDA